MGSLRPEGEAANKLLPSGREMRNNTNIAEWRLNSFPLSIFVRRRYWQRTLVRVLLLVSTCFHLFTNAKHSFYPPQSIPYSNYDFWAMQRILLLWKNGHEQCWRRGLEAATDNHSGFGIIIIFSRRTKYRYCQTKSEHPCPCEKLLLWSFCRSPLTGS